MKNTAKQAREDRVLELQTTNRRCVSIQAIGPRKMPAAPIKRPGGIKTAPKQKPGPLCVIACNFCMDRGFWRWVERVHGRKCEDWEAAKDFVLAECHIESRKDLDVNMTAATLFHNRIRKPFLAWRGG